MTDALLELSRLEGVPSALQAARDAVDAVLRDRGLRRLPPERLARARWTSARASAELERRTEGSPSSGEGDGVGDRDRDLDVDLDVAEGRWLGGCLRLYAELPELAETVRRSPPQTLARAHTLLARDLAPSNQLGRLRVAAEGRIRQLGELLAAGSAAPALVLAAIAHAEVATARPFGAGDAILGRAVEHMLLIEAGVDPPAAIVVEAGHLAAADTYPSALAGYQTGRASGVRNWLVVAAAAVARGAEESARLESTG